MIDDEQQIRFTQNWTKAQPDVAAYVRAVVRDADAAKDIVQETAVVLLRKFEQWDSTRPFLPWALGIAKFEILAHRRDSARERLVFDDALLDAVTESWSSVVAELDGEQSALQECLETLAPKAREIVRLRYFEELTAKQVANRIGSTAGAARISLMRIRQQLHECVQRRLGVAGGDV